LTVAQDQPASSTQPDNSAQSTNINPAASPPEGTVVKHKEPDTIVQPKNAPVKLNPTVIQDAQRALAEKGYDPGPADGVSGPQTRVAVKNFQADQNLAQTGRLDQKTLAALNVGGIQAIKAAPSDLGRGGKAIGHNVVGGHPVAAGKSAVTGGKNFGKKVGEGAESTAVKVKDKAGSAISTIGGKISGAGEKTKEAGETTERKAEETTSKPSENPPQR
jgi:peptidoglycan hydrolase-like protein with peptidoglycan-binding domain